jgi:hypothetical protein
MRTEARERRGFFFPFLLIETRHSSAKPWRFCQVIYFNKTHIYMGVFDIAVATAPLILEKTIVL